MAAHDKRRRGEAAAAAIGYPVVLKLQSPDAIHKTDLGGVVLNLADAAAVRGAFARITTTIPGSGAGRRA
ncbi:MAG: acetate--CoA ligase family protein [Pseudomonadota bacterium]